MSTYSRVFTNKTVDFKREKGIIPLVYDKDHKLLFAKIIEVGSSKLLGVDIVPHQENLNIHIWSYRELHEQLGHPNDVALRASAKKFTLKFDSTPMPCENCACAKIKIKNFPKQPPSFLAKEKGDRIMFDISSFNALSQGGNQFWLLIMYDYTNYSWSFFLTHKDDLPPVMMQWLRQVTYQCMIKIKCFRCDTSGENKSFQTLLKKKWKQYVKFESTAPSTPQQNGKIERKLATLYGKIWSILNAAGFPAFLRSRLWSYTATCVTQLENTIVDSSTMTASEKFTRSNPRWFKNLNTFGEIGITYNNQKIKEKLDNRGCPCMFIGYTDDHASNVYLFFNLSNQAIFMSHNVVWLHKLFHQHMNTKSALISGFTAYDITPANENNAVVPPAVASTIAHAPIPQRLTLANAPRTFTFPTVTSTLPVKRVMMMMDLQFLLQPLMLLLIWRILMLL
jgi:hypothetical protein